MTNELYDKVIDSVEQSYFEMKNELLSLPKKELYEKGCKIFFIEELYNLLVYDYIYTDEEADRILNCRGNIFEYLYTEWIDRDCSHRDEFVDAAASTFEMLP